MLLTKQKRVFGVVMIVAALGVNGLTYRAADQAPSAPAKKKGGDKPPTKLEALRQEVELLKRKLEVVQQKLRVHEAELRAIRTGAADEVKKRARAESALTAPQAVKPMDKADADVLYINLKPFALKDFQDRLPADVLSRVRARFRDGDVCILIPGKEPMRRTDFKVWLKQQFDDAKQLAEDRGGKEVNTTIVIRAHGDTDYAQVFEILQMCKNTGYTNLKQRALEEKTKEAEVKRARIAHRVRAVEIALQAVQNADDKESRQQAMDAVEKAMRKLREELKKQDTPKNQH